MVWMVCWRFSKCNKESTFYESKEEAELFYKDRLESSQGYSDVSIEEIDTTQYLLSCLGVNTIGEAIEEIESLKECADWCDIYR